MARIDKVERQWRYSTASNCYADSLLTLNISLCISVMTMDKPDYIASVGVVHIDQIDRLHSMTDSPQEGHSKQLT
jgi:hypothetical protein